MHETGSIRILSAPLRAAISDFRERRRLKTDAAAIQILLEIGVTSDQSAVRSNPTFPGKIAVPKDLPRRVKRALANAARDLQEAAAYGERPLPATLKMRLRRTAQELEWTRRRSNGLLCRPQRRNELPA
jgi:hypothetical protein